MSTHLQEYFQAMKEGFESGSKMKRRGHAHIGEGTFFSMFQIQFWSMVILNIWMLIFNIGNSYYWNPSGWLYVLFSPETWTLMGINVYFLVSMVILAFLRGYRKA